MPAFQKTWVGGVLGCLMIQGGLIGFGLIADHWFNPKAPCCTQHLVL